MYRLFIPAIELEITHDNMHVLLAIVDEIKAGRYIMQEMGWIEAKTPPPSLELPTPL